MSLCTACGTNIVGDVELCGHHHQVVAAEIDWAVANRIMCDLLHRGKTPRRLMLRERDEDFWNAFVA